MALLMASGIAVLTACGVYLLLRPRTFDTILGLTLISYGVNLFIFSMGRLAVNRAPIVEAGASGWADPLPQALVLTAIVIGFAMTALLLVLAVRAHASSGSDHVDGTEPGAGGAGGETDDVPDGVPGERPTHGSANDRGRSTTAPQAQAQAQAQGQAQGQGQQTGGQQGQEHRQQQGQGHASGPVVRPAVLQLLRGPPPPPHPAPETPSR